MLETKSVWPPVEKRDGLRILTTRFRGRGMPAARYHVWMANLGPSELLLRALKRGALSWPEFARRYRGEWFAPAAIDRKNWIIKNHGQKFNLRLLKFLARRGTVTLLCHCAEEEQQCHRHVLKRVLLGKSI